MTMSWGSEFHRLNIHGINTCTKKAHAVSSPGWGRFRKLQRGKGNDFPLSFPKAPTCNVSPQTYTNSLAGASRRRRKGSRSLGNGACHCHWIHHSSCLPSPSLPSLPSLAELPLRRVCCGLPSGAPAPDVFTRCQSVFCTCFKVVNARRALVPPQPHGFGPFEMSVPRIETGGYIKIKIKEAEI